MHLSVQNQRCCLLWQLLTSARIQVTVETICHLSPRCYSCGVWLSHVVVACGCSSYQTLWLLIMNGVAVLINCLWSIMLSSVTVWNHSPFLGSKSLPKSRKEESKVNKNISIQLTATTNRSRLTSRDDPNECEWSLLLLTMLLVVMMEADGKISSLSQFGDCSPSWALLLHEICLFIEGLLSLRPVHDADEVYSVYNAADIPLYWPFVRAMIICDNFSRSTYCTHRSGAKM
jgi:hypothetical protein